MSNAPDDPSGVLVYPKVSKGKQSDPPPVRGFGRKDRDRDKRKWYAAIGLALVGGTILGFVLTPSHAEEAKKAKTDAATADKARTVEKDRADGLDKALAQLKQDKGDEDKQLAALSGKAADVDKKADQLAAEEKKMQATIDKSQGSVETEGDEIHLKLVDKVLFPTGEDQLTDRG
ncbi:MAG TPA: hypothetical protein VFQ65_03255, partial [Kofleriaceae bacterium]|nr:hypothetical protein [Kofleriaceae bacterium]